MRIIHALEGHSWSGGQQQALFLVQGQAARGHQVRLICQKDSVLEKRACALHLDVVPHDYRGEMNLLSIYELNREFRDFKPDVVNVHRARAATQWLWVSLLNRFHGLIVTRRVAFKAGFNPLSRVKYLSHLIRGYIAVSRLTAERLKEIGIRESKIRVIYPASDAERFNPNATEPLTGPWPVSDGSPVALMIANYSRNKGYDVLLDAFKIVSTKWPELHLVIAGNGTDSQEFAAQCSALPTHDRIHILGYRTDAPALFARASFSINASYEEGCAGTIRESLLMGVPVVASDIPANRELAEIFPLRFFKCGDACSLAEAVLSMKNAESKSSAAFMRSAAIKAFSIDSMVENTLRVYREFGINVP